MKILELRDTFYEASSSTSELARKLAFAGIAIIWVLRVGEQSDIPFSENLIDPLYCFVLGLAMDIFQYIYKTVIYWALNNYYWRQYQNNEHEVEISSFFNLPTHLLFWGKTALVAYGFIKLLYYLHDKL